MVRISKQGERRHMSPRKPRMPSLKTGVRKENLKNGYKVHENAVEGDLAGSLFIPKIK